MPSGTNSSDTGIGTNVKTNLAADATAKTAQLDVGVQNKIVTLSGTADTSAVRERAIAVARATNGVATVVDQITLTEHGAGPGMGRGMMEKGKGMMDDKGHPGDAKRE